MKCFTVALLIAAQILAAVPAAAAELGDDRLVSQQRGTFAGARVRLPFGGEESGKLRAGLSLTSMQRVDLAGRGSRTSFAPGAELRLSSEAPELRLGGAPLSQRLAAAETEGQRKKGGGVGKTVLKGGAILLIVGAVVVGGLVLALFAHCETTSQCED